MPCRVSVNPDGAVGRLDRPAEAADDAGPTAGEPPWPAWLPMARTAAPRPTLAESPIGAAVSPVAPSSWSTAMSAATSMPTMRAG